MYISQRKAQLERKFAISNLVALYTIVLFGVVVEQLLKKKCQILRYCLQKVDQIHVKFDQSGLKMFPTVYC